MTKEELRIVCEELRSLPHLPPARAPVVKADVVVEDGWVAVDGDVS